MEKTGKLYHFENPDERYKGGQMHASCAEYHSDQYFVQSH